MKIEILDPSPPYGVVYTLLGGGAQSPEDLRMNAETLFQLQQGLRASDSKFYNRGNMQHRFEFQATRSYNTVNAAELALFDHPGEVPTSGILRLTPENAGAGDVRYLRDATIHAFAASQGGTVIVWHYSLSGGSLSATAP